MKRFSHTSLLLPLFSGVLLALTLPAFGLWPLVWVALVPYLVFIKSERHVSRLVAGTLIFALPYALCAAQPLLKIGDWWWVLGAGAYPLTRTLLYGGGVFLLALWGSLFFLPFTFFFARYRASRYAIPLTAFFFVLTEYFRSTVTLMGFSWGVVGYTLLDTHYLKFIAHPFTVYALSLLVIAVNLFVAFFVTHDSFHWNGARFVGILKRMLFSSRERWGYCFVPLLFIAAFCYGHYREAHLPCLASSMHVTAIGSMIPTIESFGEGSYRFYRSALLKELAESPDVVLLPENSLPYFEIVERDGSLNPNSLIPLPQREELYKDLLHISSLYPHATIAIGLHTIEGHDRYNSLVFFKGGAPVSYYHKRKLIPFAEYTPFASPVSVIVPFRKGANDQPLSIDGHRVGALICSEVGDTSLTLSGSEIILISANDSVFDFGGAALVHQDMARMRALENGAYVLRAAKGGFTSVIAPDGRVIERSSGDTITATIGGSCDK